MKVIFLDIDGVLNGYNWRNLTCFWILSKLHLLKYINKYYDIFGIRPYMVRYLSKICKKTGAKVVLSSSWRIRWNKPYDPNNLRIGALHKNFNKYHIDVIGITPNIDGSRGKEIESYINSHSEIENFIIIDDESFNIKEIFPDNLILTSKNRNICGHWSEQSGLKRKHVKKAIQLLSNKKGNNYV